MHADFFKGAPNGLVVFTKANAEFVHEVDLLFAVVTGLGALSGGSGGGGLMISETNEECSRRQSPRCG